MKSVLRAGILALALISPALSAYADSPVILPGGCGTGNVSGGLAYLTVDSSGRLCDSAGAGYSYAHISTNATTVVKAAAGSLHSITINSKGASANIATVYDGVSAAGTVIGIIDTTAGSQNFLYDVALSAGLTIVTATGTAADITVSYK
jgi:hypothetical protein